MRCDRVVRSAQMQHFQGGRIFEPVKSNDNYAEIDLVALARELWKRIWLIVLAAALAGAVGLAYARFMVTPMYTASAMIYVNNSSLTVGSTKVSISSSDLSAAQSLVDTYVVILNTRTTLNEVIREANVSYSYNQLKGMISAAAVNSTEVFEIKVTTPDRNDSERVANTIAKILPGRISDVVDVTSARVVDYAVTPVTRSSPSYTRYTALGILIGFVLSCGVIVLKELFDEQIHGEEYLLQTYPDIPVLAVIPDLAQSSGVKYSTDYRDVRGA